MKNHVDCILFYIYIHSLPPLTLGLICGEEGEEGRFLYPCDKENADGALVLVVSHTRRLF